MSLLKAVVDFNIKEEAQKLVLLGMNEAEIPYFTALAFDLASRQKNHVWNEQPRWSLKGTLGTGLNNTITTSIPATPALIAIMKINEVIKINGEQMIISAVDKVGNTFDVKGRGHAGTPVSAHPGTSTVNILGSADPEGVVTDRYEKSKRVEYTNHFQEMTENIHLTNRAIAKSHKDRDNLLAEERLARMITHLEKINVILRLSNGAYDSVEGQHTMKGYEQQIIDANGITQGTLGYTNGAFGLVDWSNMQLELAKRNADVTHIHTNAATKDFLINLVGSAYQRNDNNQGTTNNTMGAHFDSIILEKTGKKLYFILDESFDGYQMNLISLRRHMIVPTVHVDGEDHMFKISDEPSNSKVINESLESAMTLEVIHAERQVVLKNLQ